MSTRPLTQADADEFYELMREFYFNYSPKETITAELAVFDEWAINIPEIDILESSLTDESYITLVAEDDGRLLGYVTGTIKDNPRKKLNKEGHIVDIYVANGQRGKGIGRALMGAISDIFKQRDCTHLTLQAFVTNKKAIELYQHLGFTEESVVMKKKLAKDPKAYPNQPI